MKNKSIYITNVIIVLTIFLIVLIYNNISPFGANNISISGGTAQFLPMIYGFFIKIRLGTLGTFNFNNGLENPVLFSALYYTISSINYLLIPTLVSIISFISLIISVIIKGIKKKKMVIKC